MKALPTTSMTRGKEGSVKMSRQSSGAEAGTYR